MRPAAAPTVLIFDMLRVLDVVNMVHPNAGPTVLRYRS